MGLKLYRVHPLLLHEEIECTGIGGFILPLPAVRHRPTLQYNLSLLSLQPLFLSCVFLHLSFLFLRLHYHNHYKVD